MLQLLFLQQWFKRVNTKTTQLVIKTQQCPPNVS